MSEEAERFLRWYAHLPAHVPLDQRARSALLKRALANREELAEYLLKQECTPALLGEFINRHWNDAISDVLTSASLRLALRVIKELERITDERDWRATLDGFARGMIPSARVLRQLCEGINDAR